MPSKSPALASASNSPSVVDWLKPRRAEAIARLRNNGFATLVVLITAQLLPVFPSPITCLSFLLRGGVARGMGSVTQVACWLEIVVFGVLGFNILQASYALQYPPPQYGPLDTPAKRAQTSAPAPRRLKPLSPPQQTPTSLPRQNSHSGSTLYAPSPFSTPSRTMSYTIPSPSPSGSVVNSSFNSSFSSLSSPPHLASSPLASYRARHGQPIGRPMDGNLLSRLQAADDDDY